MRKIASLLCTLLLTLPALLPAQDSIRQRVILIGDAGEMDKEQKAVIPHAASLILNGRTTVIYLGDNIYPHGMGLPGSKEEAESQQILRSQYELFRRQGAPVYFVPGNHDWDKSGPDGLAKIRRQSDFLEEQGDSLLRLLPPGGCPDPQVISLGNDLVIVAFDSEWWLYPFNKTTAGGDCSCSTKQDVTAALQQILYENRYKTILLADHHPFRSYGTHGGYFTWQDHLFPLRAVNRKLYIPLPVIGSLYPFLRRTFTNPEDLRHPLYKDMIRSVDGVFAGFPNLIHLSGHEHGLQLIRDSAAGLLQIVSGAGAKHNHTFQGKQSLFAEEKQGYVTADELLDNTIRFTYYHYTGQGMAPAYSYLFTPRPYRQVEEATLNAYAADSATVQAHAGYEAGWLHRLVLGSNYRHDWAARVTLPVIRTAGIKGGLRPEKLGGGFQSTSLRLADKTGKEYTLRTVEKKPDLVVPATFQGTFVRELLDDATSAQHPYSALMVPPVAQAARVPHASPVIGLVAPDTALGSYQALFNGKVVLFEEREPLGKSDNTLKMLDNLQDDNDNTFDAPEFLRARMIDLLMGDWDRHADQWRFYNTRKKGDPKFYEAIPRDRDMVINRTQGILPVVLKRLFLLPHVRGFSSHLLTGSNFYLYKSGFLNPFPANQFRYADWQRTLQNFTASVTDSVLESSVKALPQPVYALRHDQLLQELKDRRNQVPEAMDKYYRLINQVVDIRTSDKNEFVDIADSAHQGVVVTIRKITKNGRLADTLMSKYYPQSLTREIRLYISKGDDSVVVRNRSRVRLRIIGGKGHKSYTVVDSRHKIQLYDREEEQYLGNADKLRRHLSKDSVNTAFVPTNVYNTSLPLITAALNKDDGLYLGAGFRWMQQKGFRKVPYTSLQQIMVAHAFSTKAFNLRYNGEWIHLAGKADFLLSANIKAPDNTQNFFGRGNETVFDRTGNFKRFYRTRFNIVEVQPALRWRGRKGASLSIGPALQYYHLDLESNRGRFITQTSDLKSYDSTTLGKDKTHLGAIATYELDQRNNKVLPEWGTYINVQVKAYDGVSSTTRGFVQLIPEVALYKSLNTRRTLVLSDRLGGGVTLGNTTFYQSLFLGGQGNLLGYRQYRFAGQHSFYNNLELRVVLSNFGNYIVKGQVGLGGFYDVGRVWEPHERSTKWHNGVGGNIYVAPASLFVFRMNMAYGSEGWYPSFSMGMRF